MRNQPGREELKNIPGLYETEYIPVRDKLIYLHFFLGGNDWYIAEYDGKDTFFGYAILNGDREMAEWGYISYQELKDARIPPGFEVEYDAFWEIKRAADIRKITT